MNRFLIALLAVAPIFAQSQFATLNGTVRDTTGAVLPGVTLKLTNSETGESWPSATDGEGNYVVPLVKPGPRYQLDVEKAGFKPYRRTEVVIETGGQYRIDVTMELGAQTERIVVEAAAPQLQTETSVVGAVVDNRTIVNMPLINRRAAQLARLTGFVVQNGTGSNFTMAGGRGNNANWTIDGANAQNVLLGVQTLNFDPPIEALQEFNVSVSNYSAELGRTGGGVVQMTTKSGTNEFHGSAYEYLRNDAMDARSFFSATKPKLRYNLFGASIGGPIRRDRTHFFFNYEGRRQIDETTLIHNVPTPAESRGDFSASRQMVRDPAASGRPPFAGNVIPTSRLDPIGRQIAAFYPTPNVAGAESGSANFLTNGSTKDPNNVYVSRVDHVFNDSNRIYGRLLASNGGPKDSPVWPTPGTDPFHRNRENGYYNASGTWFHNYRSNLINEFRASFDRRKFINRVGSAYTNLNQTLGIKGVNPAFGPRVTVAGYAQIGEGSNHERLQVPIWGIHLVNHVLWVKGKHNVKTGFEYRYGRNDDDNKNTAGGVFGFNDVATGHSLAALLLGWVNNANINENYPLRTRMDAVGAFLQDDFKVTPRLTLNLGMRWDMDVPRREVFDNRQNSFDPVSINSVSGTPGILTFSGRNGVSKYAHNFDRNNFAPRAGFAFRATDKWVIRGGAAMVYLGQYDQATPTSASIGFSYRGNFVSPDNGLTPAFLFRDGMPAVTKPGEADLTPTFGAVRVGQSPVTSVEYFDPVGRKTGYLTTYNFNIQRQLGWQTVVEIGYLSTLGHRLPAPASLTLNQVRPELMGAGNAQARRPFPQYTDVAQVAPPIGNSNYHGLNVKLDKRYSAGLHFQTNYTWAKGIDDAESRDELGGGAGNAYSNVYNRRNDRGLTGNSIAHRWISSVVYQLPFGKGNRFELHGAADRVFGGWSVGYIGEIRSGAPWGVIEQVNRTNSFSPQNRPNVVGVAAIEGGRSRADQIAMWFNTAAYADPGQFVFGNSGRTGGYGPGAVAMDLSVLKDIRFSERYNLQFRCEMLNFTNKPNFGLPNLNRGNATFGRITSLAPGNPARIVQLGLHFKF